MIRPRDEIRVHLCRDVVDFRKQMRGLSVLVQEELELDPFSSHLFAFCNRRRDHVRRSSRRTASPGLARSVTGWCSCRVVS